jgi:hypothetical protein
MKPITNIDEARQLLRASCDLYGQDKTRAIAYGYYNNLPATESLKRFQDLPNIMCLDGFLSTFNFATSGRDSVNAQFLDGVATIPTTATNATTSCSYTMHNTDSLVFEEEYGRYRLQSMFDGVELASIKVYPKLRRRGFGTKMLETVTAHARKANTKVYLMPGELCSTTVSLNDTQLRKWYGRHGFVDCLPLYDQGQRFSYFYPGACMVKLSGYMSLVL